MTMNDGDKLFGSHTLSHSFPNSKTQQLSAVQRLGDQGGKSKDTEEETKGK